MNQRESAKLLAFLRELDAGIVPYELYKKSENPFGHLSEEEARVSKRKFRKLKRRMKKTRKRKDLSNTQARKYIFWSFYDDVSRRG